MSTKLTRPLRGLVGTSLAWGLSWAAINSVLLFARWLPRPPDDVGRVRMAQSIMLNQVPRAFIWGCVFGAAFSVALMIAARKWPASNQLRVARLSIIGAIAGFAVPAVIVGFGSMLHVGGVLLGSAFGSGIGAGLARIAGRKSSLHKTAT